MVNPKLLDMLRNLDDRVQDVARSGYSAVADSVPERYVKMVEEAGNMLHPYRSGADKPLGERVTDDGAGLAMLLATRGIQGAGLTTAGAGLLKLTHMFANQFGGPADEPQPDTLYM